MWCDITRLVFMTRTSCETPEQFHLLCYCLYNLTEPETNHPQTTRASMYTYSVCPPSPPALSIRVSCKAQGTRWSQVWVQTLTLYKFLFGGNSSNRARRSARVVYSMTMRFVAIKVNTSDTIKHKTNYCHVIG